MVFPVGVSTATVYVSTIQDRVRDDEETFTLRLYNLETRGLTRGSDKWTSHLLVRMLPSEKTVYATIGERRYEDEKYGSGYSGPVFGE